MNLAAVVDSTNNGSVLLTGGAGYVGTHTALQLLEQNLNVVVIDNLVSLSDTKSDKPESLKRVEKLTNKQLAYYNCDIQNADQLNDILNKHKIDCVIHLAALKAVGESCSKPLLYYRNNVGGLINLLEVMGSHNVKKFVFSSSATVYGSPQYLPIDEQHETGRQCTNPYGKSKYFCEEILRDLCTADPEWNVVCLRYFNPVGAHESGQIGEDPNGVPNNLMPYVAQVAVGRRPVLHVFGNDYQTIDGTGVRDYIHIMDLADGHLAAMNYMNGSSAGWKAFNLGLGKGHSVLEIAKCFQEISGQSISLQFDPRREGDVSACYSNCSLALKHLKWQAKRTLHDMCQDMWRWQSTNPDGYA